MRWSLAPLAAAYAPMMEQRFAEACQGRGVGDGTVEMARCVEGRRVAQREHTSQVVWALLSSPGHRTAIAGRS